MNTNYTCPSAFDFSTNLQLSVTTGAPANGQAYNTATASVTQNNSPLYNAKVDFYVTGSALFSNGQHAISITTNQQGLALASFTNTVPETVALQAIYQNDTAYDSATFSQVSIPNYSLIPVFFTHIYIGQTQFQLRYRLINLDNLQGVPNQTITLTGLAPIPHPATGTTDSMGLVNWHISTSITGYFTIVAALKNFPSISTSRAVAVFPNIYPRLTMFKTANLQGVASANRLLHNTLNLQKGHRYRLLLDRQPTSIQNCPNGNTLWSTINGNDAYCTPNVPQNLQLVNPVDLSEFIVLESMLIANGAFTRRWYEFANPTETAINVYDYGPQ